MSRKPRIHYEGALYHVIIRGNNREYIFKEELWKKQEPKGSGVAKSLKCDIMKQKL